MSQWAAGKYKAKIEGATCSATSKGTPQMVVQLDIGGHKKNANLYFSDKAQEQSLKKLREIGFNGDFENPKFTDEEIEVTLRFEDYNGKPQERWELPWPAAAPVDKSTMMSLGAMFKATASTPPPPPPPAIAPPPAPKAPPASAPSPAKKAATATRDEAWAACVKLSSTEGNDATMLWTDALEKVEKKTSRKETEFTPEDWGLVLAEWVPF